MTVTALTSGDDPECCLLYMQNYKQPNIITVFSRADYITVYNTSCPFTKLRTAVIKHVDSLQVPLNAAVFLLSGAADFINGFLETSAAKVPRFLLQSNSCS